VHFFCGSAMTTLTSDSYTARRLEHATPEHLHLTARRQFIGPIPEGWLKGHRKQWYKQILRQRSGRVPSFNVEGPSASSSVHAGSRRDEAGDEQPRPSSQSAETQPGAATRDTTTSLTSLLHEQRGGSGVESSSVRQRTQDATDAPTNDTLTKRTLSSSLGLQRAVTMLPTPRVRFSDSTRLQLRARAQRLAAKGSLRSSKVREGEVLKMDRMLVRVDITQQSIGPDFDEKISQGVESKSLDKWREFMIVCRRHTEEDAEAILQLYQTRVIAATAAGMDKARTRAKAEVLLSPRRCKVNLFSSLDKTLCVWTLEGSRTRIYYLRPQSGATSVEWLTFLRGILGAKRAQTLQVNVPDLSVTLRLDDPFRILETSRLLAEAAEGDDSALARAISEEKGAAGAIVARCVEMLEQSPEWTDVIKAWAQYGRIGLAWKRYDRLEWVHGAVEQKMYGTIAMQRTHDLELRPKNHYPLTAKALSTEASGNKGQTLSEPLPVEGFLIRLTSQRGHERRMGKMLFKRLYFTSQNQFLLFLRPGSATPPPPPQMSAKDDSSVPSSKQLIEQTPLTYTIDPYPLSDDLKHITWLDSEGVKPGADQRARDQQAQVEAERNMQMLLNADGFVNLVDVRRVRKMYRGATPADENLDDGPDVNFDVQASDDNTTQDDGATTEIDEDRVFELLMKNGLVIRLQAYNKTAKLEWMKRLKALVTYWQARAKQDTAVLKSVREQNLEALQIDERAEAAVGSFAYKWEVGQSFASPIMYHMCGIAQCRTIHLSGVLFRKPRRHTTFTRCQVILSHGHLLVFQDTLRSRTGEKLVHIHHERVASISLKGCYLYSGVLTENDLLYQNRTFDSNMPGHHTLPRVYLEDGWTSTDEDAMTTFVIWHSKSKSWFRSSHFVDDVRESESKAATEAREEARRERGEWMMQGRTRKKLTRVSQLGTTGRSVVFKARSRAERDHWVMAIQVEIERLAAQEAAEGEDVRLVEDGKDK